MRALGHLPAFGVFVSVACGGTPAPQAEPPVRPGSPVEEAEAEAPAAERLADLAARFWEWQLERSPELGTSIGDSRRDDRLSDLSDSARLRNAEAANRMREELHGIEPEELSGQDRITWEVLDLKLDQIAESVRLGFHLWDVDQMYGPHVSFPYLVRQQHPRRTARDVENLLARYRAHPKQLDDTVANLRAGLAKGAVASRASVERVIEQIEIELAKPAGERSLAADPRKLPEAIPEQQRRDLAGAMNDVLEREIRPTLDRMRKMLADEYLPRTGEEVGIWTIPNGEEAYRFRIRQHTSTDLGPREIHEIGQRELRSIEEEMLAIARKLGHRGDLASFSKRVKRDRNNYHRTREKLLAGFREIHERAWKALPRAFGRLPRARCEVRPMEAFQERDSPAAYYNAPAEDGSRPGVFLANLYEPRQRPKYNMEALTFHEAVPGHHLQIALAQEVTGLPDFRRHGGFTVLVEGWGLYAERLSDELGLYTSDLSRYGMLNYQAWRANRLIVDTGMHEMRWSRQQAIDWMTDHTALSEREVANEIDRYIIWPGQALAYMIGALEIRQLRREAEEALGDRFDLREFHDVLLGSGAVPMATAERLIDEWIEGKRDGSGGAAAE